MKLTKKNEAEAIQVYEAYWSAILNADTKALAELIDDDFRQIGSTAAEVFFNKIDTIEFVNATADQVIGNIELRNRIIKLEPIDGLIIITEQNDAYVRIETGWTFYSKVRASSLLQNKEKSWKLIQQHVSFPDSKAEEGETIAIEKISKENLQLREAVKRRTIELEQKNRELEIEAALERVRARAMGMRYGGGCVVF